MTKYSETIVVDSDGEILSYTNGLLSGPAKLINIAKRNSRARLPVQLIPPFGETFEANLEDPNERLNVLAAMFSVNPGRSRVLEAPDEIETYIFINGQQESDEEYDPNEKTNKEEGQ